MAIDCFPLEQKRGEKTPNFKRDLTFAHSACKDGLGEKLHITICIEI